MSQHVGGFLQPIITRRRRCVSCWRGFWITASAVSGFLQQLLPTGSSLKHLCVVFKSWTSSAFVHLLCLVSDVPEGQVRSVDSWSKTPGLEWHTHKVLHFCSSGCVSVATAKNEGKYFKVYSNEKSVTRNAIRLAHNDISEPGRRILQHTNMQAEHHPPTNTRNNQSSCLNARVSTNQVPHCVCVILPAGQNPLRSWFSSGFRRFNTITVKSLFLCSWGLDHT